MVAINWIMPSSILHQILFMQTTMSLRLIFTQWYRHAMPWVGMIVFFLLMIIVYLLMIVYKKTQLTLDLKQRENDYTLLMNEMNAGFVLVQADNALERFVITKTNQRFRMMMNQSREQLKGRLLNEVISVSDDVFHHQVREAAITGLAFNYESYSDPLRQWWDYSVYQPKKGFVAIMIHDITRQKTTELQLQESEKQLQQVYNITGEGLWDWHINEGKVYHNKRWCEIYGLDDSHLVHSLEEFIQLLHPEEREETWQRINQMIQENGKFFSEHRIVRADKTVLYVRDRGVVVKEVQGKPQNVIGSVSDITDFKQIQQDLFFEKEMLHATVFSVRDSIIVTTVPGRITLMNPACEELLGYKQEEVLGKYLHEVADLYDPITRTKIDLSTYDSVKSFTEALLVTHSGKEYLVLYSAALIQNKDGEIFGFVGVIHDVSEIREKQSQIEYLSYHDELTGFYNRRYIENALQGMDNLNNYPLTIFMIDLNNLKLKNDVFGHHTGDLLIRKTADLLRDVFRTNDMIARIGGDEFCVLLPNTNNETAALIKNRIQKTTTDYNDGLLKMSLAIGFATKTQPDEKIEDIMRNADNSMYKDKLIVKPKFRKDLMESYIGMNRENLKLEERHSKRVSSLAGALYQQIGKDAHEVKSFMEAVLVHDVGKIAIPQEVLNKVDEPTAEEWELLHRHSKSGYQILYLLEMHQEYAQAILHHHEHYDGTGYPAGLKGEDIPLEAKVICIADSYGAMTSNRPYKKAFTKQEAIEELRACAGTHFDPELVNVFIEHVLPMEVDLMKDDGFTN